MELADAKALAGRFVSLIAPFSERIRIVGSIRRERPQVKDADIVAIPKTVMAPQAGWFVKDLEEVSALHKRVEEMLDEGIVKPRLRKNRTQMVGKNVAFLEYEGFGVDIYYATPDRWWGLVQVRTGSAPFNMHIANRALRQGKRLHADGTGIWDADNMRRIDDGQSEESIFRALEMRYYRPEEREIPFTE